MSIPWKHLTDEEVAALLYALESEADDIDEHGYNPALLNAVERLATAANTEYHRRKLDYKQFVKKPR